MFVNQTYGFNEGDTSEIGVKISNEIAKNLTVLITGGKQKYNLDISVKLFVCSVQFLVPRLV